MTTEQYITRVGLLSGETNTTIIEQYLDIAREAILQRAYPYLEDFDGLDFPRKYSSKLVEITTALVLKQGAEGETSHNENGVSRTYEGGSIPKSMLKDIVPFCKVVGGSE